MVINLLVLGNLCVVHGGVVNEGVSVCIKDFDQSVHFTALLNATRIELQIELENQSAVIIEGQIINDGIKSELRAANLSVLVSCSVICSDAHL